MLNVPVGTYLTFYRNTVEIAENSENHLKAIVDGRQEVGRIRFRGRAGKRGQEAKGRRESGGGRVSTIALRGRECQLHGVRGKWGTVPSRPRFF